MSRYTLLWLLFSVWCFGQTATENYILSTTCLDADCVKKSQTIQYFDGLGRLKQSIGIKATPKGRDLVTPTEYDNYGRQTKDYLPIPQSGTQNGGFYQNPLSNAPSVYGNESIYSEKILENSPLDRVLGQIQVGNDWRNKPVRFQYEANLTTDGVYKMTTRTTWEQGATKSTISILGTYADAQLYKTTTTDEDGNPSIEFKNGEGQTLLVRKILEGKNIDTYYIYNEYNQLAFVIPPLAVEEIAKTTNLSVLTLDSLCYQYRYDGKGRMVEKKLPGKGWEYMIYDQLDRLVLTQDANLRGTGNNFKAQGWIFTKYDQFNRVVYTGFFRNSSTREQMQTALNNIRSNHHESRSHTPFNFNNNDIYYTRNAFPKSSLTILSVNYYDTYPANSPAMPNDIWGQETLKPEVVNHRSTKGLALVSMVKNIEDDSWTKNYTYYDTKGRVIGTLSQNHLGGYTKTESRLDFSGIAQQTNTYHKRQSSDKEIKIAERFEYNAHNPALLEKHYHQVNEETEELLAEHSYNEIGQLETKKVGGTQGNPLQTINYQYNIRGWMTGINTDKYGNFEQNKLFSYRINYNQPLQGLSQPNYHYPNLVVKPKFNGNISEVAWKYTTPENLNTETMIYGYVYDGLNRLLAGFNQPNSDKGAGINSEIITYDANGNIQTLKRTGQKQQTSAILIDDLAYTYEGNQVKDIVDKSNNGSGFKGMKSHFGNRISYDANGNMLNLLGNGIMQITYNHLNLPNSVSMGIVGGSSSYRYRADGVKIRMSHSNVYTYSSTEKTTDYLDGFVYNSSVYTTKEIMDIGFPSNPQPKIELGMEGEAYLPLSQPPMRDNVTREEARLSFFATAEGYYDYEKKNYIYQYKDHLGNTRVSYARIKGKLEILDQNDYYPFGMNHLQTGSSRFGMGSWQNYKYNGKELQESGMYDYGARFYMPDIGRWGVIDPLAEKMTRHSPYNYAFNNPIRFIDPDGRDPIYGKNFWGRTKLIGDDGKSAGKSYLVRGAVKREVKASTKAGNNYTGSLAENSNVFKIPTGGVMDDVIRSVNDTETSKKEQGGHANFGDANATRWDEGSAAFSLTDTDGVEKVKATLTMFKIGGENMMPSDASNVEYWWHTHPNTTVNGTSLGNSNPSEADFRGQTTMQNKGFKGNTFVIGVRSGTVTFYNKDKALITVKYSDFKKMGGK